MTCRNQLNRLGPDLVALISLLVCALIYTWGLYEHFDVWLYDESAYLNNGLNLLSALPSGENAPLYAVWYFLLSLIQPDLVALYYLNLRILSVLLPLFMYVALRATRSKTILSFVVSLYVLTCWGNYLVWPKVSHFLLLILLMGILLSACVESYFFKTAILATAGLMSAYVRPEFFIAFCLLAVLLGVLLARRGLKNISVPEIAKAFWIVGIWGVLVSVFSWPIGGGNRSMIAFGQHFASNYVDWTNDPRNPITMWGEITTENFGLISSPLQAIFANPMAVTRHVWMNIIKFPHAIFNVFGGTNSTSHLGMVIIWLALLGLAVITGLLRYQKSAQWIKGASISKWVQEGRTAFLLLPFLLPTVISIVGIYPRVHYIIILGIVSLIVLCSFLSARPLHLDVSAIQSQESVLRGVFFICSLSVLLMKPLFTSTEISTRPNLLTIEFVKTLHLKKQVNMLEAEGGYSIYLGHNFRRVAEYDKNESFKAFMQSFNVNLIVLSPGIEQDQRFIKDPEWQDFIKHPVAEGFVELSIPGTDERRLLIRSALLN